MEEILNVKFRQLLMKDDSRHLLRLLFTPQYSCDINLILTSNGDTILHMASRYNKIKTVKLLLESGVHINKCNYNELTPLFVSTNLEITKLLIDRGANVNQRDNQGNIPLHLIIPYGSIRLIDLHLKRGAQPLASNIYNTTPTMEACKLSSSKVIRYLMKNGGNLIRFNTDGHNGLHMACIQDSIDVVKYIVSRIPPVININDQDALLRTPLHFTVSLNRYETSKILLNHNANLEVYDKKGLTPLHNALNYRNIKMIALLLNHGALMKFEHETVRQFLYKINYPNEPKFIFLLCFHLFVDNNIIYFDAITDQIIDNWKIFQHLHDLRRVSRQIQYKSKVFGTFPHILKKPPKILAHKLKNDTRRLLLKDYIDDMHTTRVMLKFILDKYNNAMRIIGYNLIKKRHIVNRQCCGTLTKLRCRKLLTKILDFLNLIDLKSVLYALGIYEVDYFF